MATKLYQPLINGIIPACYLNTNGTVDLTVPFSLNPENPIILIEDMCLKVFSIITNQVIFEEINSVSYDLEKGEAKFIIPSNSKINTNQFYKIQIAFKNSSSVGYFSDVSTVKITKKPDITIEGLSTNIINNYNYSFVGKYKNNDITEKIYSSHFIIKEKDTGKIILKSGEIIHNAIEDTEDNESREIYETLEDLAANKQYTVQYFITTINGYQGSSAEYLIAQTPASSESVNGLLIMVNNYENSYIDITFKKNKDIDYLPQGTYYLTRAKLDELTSAQLNLYRTSTKESLNRDFAEWDRIYSQDNIHWKKIKEFKIIDDKTISLNYKDFTIEQGVRYVYGIQRYTDGTFSREFYSDGIDADYEDSFLLDQNKKQLVIKFNPQVSSYRTVVLEQKIDTIGSKYPFIFKSGKIKYKEIPISGLISYTADENQMFIEWDALGVENKSFSLEGYNINAEYIFRERVIDWLQNGEPKLLKTPTEGNFIVNLINVSFAPQAESINRLIYNFSATAIEIADYTEENLKKYNFL